MIIIVISGPSGSGKSYLANKLLQIFQDSIILKTDSYYRDNIFIRFLSIFKYDIYDRTISINKSEIKMNLTSILNKDKIISLSSYDFKSKVSMKSKKIINYNSKNQFLILEGIFSHRLELNYHKTINIICENKKEICFKRRLERDKKERGRNSREVRKRFNKSWNLFYQNIDNFLYMNKVMVHNTLDINSFNQLVYNLTKIKNN